MMTKYIYPLILIACLFVPGLRYAMLFAAVVQLLVNAVNDVRKKMFRGKKLDGIAPSIRTKNN